jgi:hypothetical protein
MMILFLAAIAHASPSTVYVESGASIVASGPCFIVHEQRMNELLALAESAKELGIRIDELAAKSTIEISALTEALIAARVALGDDAVVIAEAQARAVADANSIRRLRSQRNVAVVMASGMITGAAVAWRVAR